MKIFLRMLPIVLFLPLSGMADDAVYQRDCEITPQVWSIEAWPETTKTNNLRRKVGTPDSAKGQQLLVSGKILDINCVPVANATVQIWQNSSIGRGLDENFLGSGTASTDNLGQFNFLTVMPAADKNRSPHINFRIMHKDFFPTETVMYFENQPSNQFDKVLKTEIDADKKHLLLAKEKKSIKNRFEEGTKYHFDVTIEGKNKYLKY